MHLAQCIAAHALDHDHRGASGLGVSVEQSLGGPRLDPHHADAVGDEIVQLARDPGAFFGRRGPASLVAFALGLRHLHLTAADEPAHAPRDSEQEQIERPVRGVAHPRRRRGRDRKPGDADPEAEVVAARPLIQRHRIRHHHGREPAPEEQHRGRDEHQLHHGGGDHHRQRRGRRASTPRHRSGVEQHQHRVQAGRTVKPAARKLVAPRTPDVHLPDDHEHQRQHRVGERRPHTIDEPAN